MQQTNHMRSMRPNFTLQQPRNRLHSQLSSTCYTGWPTKNKPLPNDQKIVLKPVNEIIFSRQIKV